MSTTLYPDTLSLILSNLRDNKAPLASPISFKSWACVYKFFSYIYADIMTESGTGVILSYFFFFIL